LQQQFSGPHEVIQRVGRLAYRLDIPKEWDIDNVFLIAMLEPYPFPDPFERPLPPTEPISFDDDGVERWEVEKIVDKRVTRRGRSSRPVVEYRIRWKGFSVDRDMWVKDSDIDAPEAIATYEQAQDVQPTPVEPKRKRGRPKKVMQAALERVRALYRS
jgi:hypothetical protein